MTSKLNELLKSLECLVTTASQNDTVQKRNECFCCLRRIAVGWLSSDDIRLKSQLQGLMSCVFAYSKIDEVFGNQELEAANELMSYLFQECTKLLLQMEHVGLGRRDTTLSLVCKIVQSILVNDADSRHLKYFELLKMLIEKPWNNPQITAMLDENELTKKRISDFVNEVETAELVLLRIEALFERNHSDLAKRLINRFVLVKGDDTKLMSSLFALLHKANQYDEFHVQCTKISCCMACNILHHMNEIDSYQSVALLASRTLFLLSWAGTADLSCTKILMQYWLTLERQHFMDDEKEFCSSLNKILALTNSSDKLVIFIDVIETLFSSKYMTMCLEIALKVLRSVRHRFTCAQLYVKDASEINDASRSLALICKILVRYFSHHPQMNMTCLLSAACISPSNDHYMLLRRFFESFYDPISLHPVAPSGVDWDLYVALWDAVKYLQPERFQSLADWEAINSNLRSYYRSAGWRFDSLTMVFKKNHNRKGIGCGIKGAIKQQKMLAISANKKSAIGNKKLAKYRGTVKSKKTGIVKENHRRPIEKKRLTGSGFPYVVLKRLPSELDTSPKDSMNDSMFTTPETANVEGEYDGSAMKSVLRKRLRGYVRQYGVKKDKSDSCGKTSFGSTDEYSQKSRNDLAHVVKSPEVSETANEISQGDFGNIDIDRGNSFVVASPALSNDSEDTIPLDNDDSNSCNIFQKFSEYDITKIDEICKNVLTEYEKTITDHESYENLTVGDGSVVGLSRSVSEQSLHATSEPLGVQPNWIQTTCSSDDLKIQNLPTALQMPSTISDLGENSSSSMPLCPLLESEDARCDKIDMGQSDASMLENDNAVEYVSCKEDLTMPALLHCGFVEEESISHCPPKDAEISAANDSVAVVADFSMLPSPHKSEETESQQIPEDDEMPKNLKTPFYCPYCSCVLFSNFAHKQHLRRAHKRGFECSLCHKLVNSPHFLKLHMSRIHGTEFQNQDLQRAKYDSERLSHSAFERDICMVGMRSISEGRCLNEINVNHVEPINDHNEVIISKVECLNSDQAQSLNCSSIPVSKRWLFKSHHRIGRKERKGSFGAKSWKNMLKISRLNSGKRIKPEKLKISKFATAVSNALLRVQAMKRSFMLKNRTRKRTDVENNSASSSSLCSSSISITQKFERLKENLSSDSALETPGTDNSSLNHYEEETCELVVPKNEFDATEKYRLKDCFVCLERLCLAKVKLRPCRVSVERLCLDEITSYQKSTYDVCSISSESEISFADDVFCLSPMSTNETLEEERLNPTTSLCVGDRLTSNAAFVSGIMSDENSERFHSEKCTKFAQCPSCLSSLGLCLLKPLVCYYCKKSYDGCTEFVLHPCPIKKYVLHSVKAQSNTDLKIQRQSVASMNNEHGKDCPRSHARESVETSCVSLSTTGRNSDGNCLSKEKDDSDVLKMSTSSQVSFLKFLGKQQNPVLNKERISKLREFRLNTCQVQLNPINSVDVETSTPSACSSSSEVSPQKKLGHRNLFDSFGESVLQSMRDDHKKSSPLSNTSEIIKETDRVRCCQEEIRSSDLADSQKCNDPRSSQNQYSSLPVRNLSMNLDKSSDLFAANKLNSSQMSNCRAHDELVHSTDQVSSAPDNKIEQKTSKQVLLPEQNDVYVISSDEEDVQVIDLDEINVYDRRRITRHSEMQHNFKWPSGSRTRYGKTKESERVGNLGRSARVADDAVIAVPDVYLCEICEKSFNNAELLLRHRDQKHRRVTIAEKQISWSAQMRNRKSSDSCVNLSSVSNLTEFNRLGFYCVSPALKKLGFRTAGASKPTSARTRELSLKLAKDERDKMHRTAKSCHLASPSKILSVGSCDGMKVNNVTRNILVMGQT